jgi:hypothetical protein
MPCRPPPPPPRHSAARVSQQTVTAGAPLPSLPVKVTTTCPRSSRTIMFHHSPPPRHNLSHLPLRNPHGHPPQSPIPVGILPGLRCILPAGQRITARSSSERSTAERAGRGGTSTFSRMAVDQMPTAKRSMHHCRRRRARHTRCAAHRAGWQPHREEVERVRAAVEAVAAYARVTGPIHARWT